MENNQENWHSQKTYESLISYGTHTIKFVVLANGGALISLLTFLGNNTDKAYSLRWAPLFFILGILLGGTSYVFSYITQLTLYNHKDIHSKWLWAAILCIVLGILSFVLGASIGMYNLTWGAI